MKKFLAHHPDGSITEHLTIMAAEDNLRPQGGTVTCTCHPDYPRPISTVVRTI